MSKSNKLQVEAIKNGTVIDHIPANAGFKILKLFALDSTEHRVTIGLNLPSSAQNTKDIIKIENVFVTKKQADQIALYAPQATVNTIIDYEVTDKYALKLPEEIFGMFKCANTNCITNYEPTTTTHFKVLPTKQGKVQLKCHYCEKVFNQEIMKEV